MINQIITILEKIDLWTMIGFVFFIVLALVIIKIILQGITERRFIKERTKLKKEIREECLSELGVYIRHKLKERKR